MTIRVRFAPSPTGHLHIGGARTALFNWLFARHTGGTFILRIEDTDEVRSTVESVQAIFDGLRWLGLDWDEGPVAAMKIAGTEHYPSKGPATGFGFYYQMERLPLYKKAVDQLIAEGKAYPCFCTAEEVQKMREKAESLKRQPKYDGTCRDLTPEQRAQKTKEGRSATIRFKAPLSGTVQFHDDIKGDMKFDNDQLDDFVIMKSSGVPTYNFACVVDDHDMQITHVLRGDDHLSNTPKQVLLYRALGWDKEMPTFAHLSMILGPDGSRLSKRHGATSVQEYQQKGYLPEALRNYLALLGWSTEDSQDLFSFDELIQKFTVDRCVKSAATFDPQKLEWMNGEYIRKMSVRELTERALPFLRDAGLIQGDVEAMRPELEKVIALEQEKIKLLTDVPKRIDIFLKEVPYDPEAVEKFLRKPDVPALLEESIKAFEALDSFSAAATEEACKALAVRRGIKNGAVFHPVRVSVSGRTQGPSLFHMLELLGKGKSIDRIRKTIAFLSAR